MKFTRREFIKGAAGAAGFLALRGALPGRAFAEADSGYPSGAWGGSEPGQCHSVIRDGGGVPGISATRRTGVCIVGGGLAGLAAAHRLRDADVLLLEHLGRTGGHASRGRWKDVWYSEAAAYCVEPEKPLDAFYAELGFPLVKIEEPSDTAFFGEKVVFDPFGGGIGKLPLPEAARRDFERARRDMKAILDGDDYPNMPIEEATPVARKLDRMSFADWLLKEQGYHPAVKAYVDIYCRSAFGAPSSERVSAFAGLNFYASELAPRYTFPGGTALAGEMLRASVDRAGAGRTVTGATVVRVEPRDSGVAVTYLDEAGHAVLVDAKAAILACPKYVARHLLPLPKDQEAAIAGLSYGTYVVANLLCSGPIAEFSYDTWSDHSPFTDFIVADWVTRGPYHRAKTKQQVLTVYWPLDYRHEEALADGSLGRFRGGAIAGMEALFKGASGKILDVRLSRWGHALCHAGPGWYTERAAVAARPLGRVLFAHSDNQGLPAFEAALAEGLAAAKKARELL
jgi:hypothetical protein